MKKKVVIQFLCGMNDGGAETLVKDYCLLSKKDDINIFPLVIYDSEEKCANKELLLNNGIIIESIYNKHSIFYRLLNRMLPKYTAFRLMRILDKYHPSAIHVHMDCLRYMACISDYLIKNNIRIMYTCHSEPREMLKKNTKEFVACQFLIEKNNLQLIALHKSMARELNEMFHVENTIVVNNGVDFAQYENIKSYRYEIRKELSIPDDSFLIGHVGRFHKVKNHNFILKVFLECQKMNKNTNLLLVGNGPLKEEILEKIKEAGIEKKVMVLEHRQDVPKLLSAMDCFIFPSLYEGLSIAAIEAQLAEVKIVMSDTIKNDVCLSKNIIVNSLNDSAESWANAVLYEEGNYDVKGDIKEFDMRCIIKQLEDLYINN